MILDYLLEISDVAINKAKEKFYDQDIDQNEVNKVLDSFKILSNKNRIKNIDIMNIDFEELKKLVQEIETKPTSKEKRTKLKSDVEKVFENDKVTIVSPLTHEASCLYGAHTKWCTTSKNPEDFNDYIINGWKLYYILPKEQSTMAWDTKKVAVAVHPKGGRLIYNIYDDKVPNDEFIKYIKYNNIPNDIFKPVSQEQQEQLFIKKYIEKWHLKVNDDGTYDTDQQVIIDSSSLIDDSGKIKFKFNNVEEFSCSNVKLLSCENFPKKCDVKFSLNNLYDLRSLKGCPSIVGQYDLNSMWKLFSFVSGPEIVKNDFLCLDNIRIKSLDGFPKSIGGNVIIRDLGFPVTFENIRKVCDVKGYIRIQYTNAIDNGWQDEREVGNKK